MLKVMLAAAVAAGALVAASASVRADQPYTFAVVPKAVANFAADELPV